MRRFIVSIVTIVALSIGPVSQSLAVEYGGIGGTPANPDPKNSRTQSIFVYSPKPGESKADGIKIANNSETAKTIEVYATDSEIASGGSFACKQKVDPKEQVGSWIKFEKNEVTLAAATNQVVNFTLTAPKQVDVGEHNGCIVIQEKAKQTESKGNGVQISLRSALRVVVTIPGDIKKDLAISSFTTKGERDKHTFTVGLHNNGNVSLDTDIQLRVRNIFGRTTYTNGGVYPVLSQSRDFELNYEMPHSFWGGFYRVQATAEYSSDPKVGLGENSNSLTKRSSAIKTIFVVPQLGAIGVYLLVLILVAAGILLFRKKRQHKQHIGATWIDYTVKKTDTVHKLAETHNTQWKTIVAFNKLKAPYALEPKSTIKLPPKPKKQAVAKKPKAPKKDTTKKSIQKKETNKTSEATADDKNT